VWLTRACLPAALQVFRHFLSQPSQQQQQQHCQQDELLFTEGDAKHFVMLTRTKDWRYVLINSHAKLSSEVRHSHWQLSAGLPALHSSIPVMFGMLPASMQHNLL
jgi:protease II